MREMRPHTIFGCLSRGLRLCSFICFGKFLAASGCLRLAEGARPAGVKGQPRRAEEPGVVRRKRRSLGGASDETRGDAELGWDAPCFSFSTFFCTSKRKWKAEHCTIIICIIYVMKKRLLALSALLALTACGGSSAEITCAVQYWDGVVGTCLPGGWHALSKEQLQTRGVPADVIAGFEREQPIAGQNPIVIVLREQVPSTVDGPAYSETSINAVKTLPSYEEIDMQSITVDDQDVNLHVYSAQPLPEQPMGRFYQVSTVSAGAGYTMTAALPLSPDDAAEAEVELILQNLTFTQQTEE